MSAESSIDASLLPTLLRFDPETGFLYWRERPREFFAMDCTWRAWNSKFSGRRAFTARNRQRGGEYVGRIFHKQLRAHRVIWALLTGYWPIGQIDHISHDTTNNRPENLREVTSQENNRNASRSHANSSGITGVSQDRKNAKWRAYIRVGYRQIALGRFSDFAAAVEARNAANAAHGFHDNHGSWCHFEAPEAQPA